MTGHRLRGAALPIVLGLVLLLAAWRVLSLGVADHYARSAPERALAWRSNHPAALVFAAEQASLRDPARASELARAALRANPLEGRAYRVLGALAEQRGELPRALQLYEIAAARSPRDLRTHAWLEREYLRTGKLGPALRHIDLLIRVEPEARESQLPLLLQLAAIPAAQPALALMLAGHPPWREYFITSLCQQAADSLAIAPFMTALGQSRGGLSEAELSAWLDRLGRDSHWGEAYLTWVAALPPAQQSELGNVFNGGFEHEPSNSGFDWRFEPVAGAYMERLATAGAGGELALRVSFDDRRVPFRHVRQLLALPPGRYRLSGRTRAEGLRSERGLVWSVLCADSNKAVASGPPVTGHTPWRPFSLAFELPAGSCGGQWLELGVPARIAAEQRIGGRAWFDDLRIVREN